MSNARTTKSYRTFVKGLVTEASPLTYPEDTSFDELNTIPTRKGNRSRRFGMNYSVSNIFIRPYVAAEARSEFLWKAVAAQTSNSFLVVQNGGTLNFFDRSKNAFAENVKSFSVDLTLYLRPGANDVRFVRCNYAAGKGYLFVVNPEIEPLVIAYNRLTDTISVKPIAILARDFEGLRDGLANDQEPSTLTAAHFYNLLNQGWVNP